MTEVIETRLLSYFEFMQSASGCRLEAKTHDPKTAGILLRFGDLQADRARSILNGQTVGTAIPAGLLERKTASAAPD